MKFLDRSVMPYFLVGCPLDLGITRNTVLMYPSVVVYLYDFMK